ncbi:hypothetical protein MYXO_02167 [Myxococcaceae bacterium]|nr:hypothetical protein MYXO_02167 [Myxococcaceae bacterium]
MAVVINEFEAVAEAPQQSAQRQEGGEGQAGQAAAPPDPHDLVPALCVLAEQALRSWAH